MLTFFAALLSGCGGGTDKEYVKTVGVDEFANIAIQSGVRTLDVRTPQEYAEGHIAGAENIDVKDTGFAERISGINGTVAVYCRGGKRSLTAARLLAANGCTVYNLDGGIMAWKKARRPTTTVETDVFETRNGKLVKLHALKHSSIRIEYDGREILVDPCAKLPNCTVDYASLPKADIILVTHEHFDHFDSATVSLLATPKTRLLMNRRCVDLYGSGTALANGDKIRLADDISVEAVPAYNTSADRLQFHPQGRDNGYVLTLDGLRIYIAGDTEEIPEMANLGHIDIAFLPCNLPFTMTTAQLVAVAGKLKPTVLFPYHYSETDLTGVAEQLPGIDVRVRHYE